MYFNLMLHFMTRTKRVHDLLGPNVGDRWCESCFNTLGM